MPIARNISQGNRLRNIEEFFSRDERFVKGYLAHGSLQITSGLRFPADSLDIPRVVAMPILQDGWSK